MTLPNETRNFQANWFFLNISHSRLIGFLSPRNARNQTFYLFTQFVLQNHAICSSFAYVARDSCFSLHNIGGLHSLLKHKMLGWVGAKGEDYVREISVLIESRNFFCFMFYKISVRKIFCVLFFFSPCVRYVSVF